MSRGVAVVSFCAYVLHTTSRLTKVGTLGLGILSNETVLFGTQMGDVMRSSLNTSDPPPSPHLELGRPELGSQHFARISVGV